MFDDQSLFRLLGLVCSVFDAYSAVLFIPDAPDGDGGGYRLAAHFSLGDNIDTRAVASQVPGGIIGWIAKNRQPLLINSFDKQRGLLGYYDPKAGEEDSIKAFMGCPLGESAGVLALDTKKSWSFSIKDQKILHQFAQFIEHVLENSGNSAASRTEGTFYKSLQLIYGMQRRFPKWSTFLKHFLEILAETSGFSHVFLAARDETGKSYFIEGWNRQPFVGGADAELAFPIGGGMVGWVFRNDAPVYNCDRDKDITSRALLGMNLKTVAFRSVVCLPLFVHRRTRGVLVLASSDQVDLDDEMKIFLQMATEHLALFLENLYLKNRLAMQKASHFPEPQEQE